MLLVAASDLYGACTVCSSVPLSDSHTHSSESRSAEITRLESISTATDAIGYE